MLILSSLNPLLNDVNHICFISKLLRKRRYLSLFQKLANDSFRQARFYGSVLYSEHGNPVRVTRLVQTTEPKIDNDHILIKFLASPINPSDINQIEGAYAVLPSLPAIPGNEGVARIEYLPEGHESGFKVGDWVIPAKPGFGTWRTHALAKPDQLIPIQSGLPLYSAATLAVNPVTAYRLLHDFMNLEPGSVIIQNAANSTVGLCIIQIAKLMNIKTINIIRDRDDFDEIEEHLHQLGADHIVRDNDTKTLMQLPKPILALNAVGGTSCTNLARSLDYGGMLITYGGMSRKPVAVPTRLLIFSDITLKGFWLTRTNQIASNEEKLNVLYRLTDMILRGHLKVDVEPVPFANFSTAIERALQGRRKGKVVLTFE